MVVLGHWEWPIIFLRAGGGGGGGLSNFQQKPARATRNEIGERGKRSESALYYLGPMFGST